MDSNFSVKITADISDLQSRLKAVEVELGKFEVSANKAAAATKGIEREANRGRLAAFAFGQVIRDAGFFSQSFGLGLLAISNNIPILIDQLVLLSNVSKVVGGAISLLGSILTAGLTIWAYSASSIKKTSEAVDSLGKSAGGEIGHLTALYTAATDVNRPMSERYKIIAKLQDLYPSYFGNLSKEAIAAGKAASSYKALRDEIINVAVAKASEEQISKKAKELADIIIADKKAEFELRKKFPKATEGEIAAMKGQGFVIDEVNGKFETQVQYINRLKKEIKDLGDIYSSIAKDFTSAAIIGDFGKVDTGELKDSIQKELEESIKAIELDPTLSKIEKITASIDAYKAALKALVDEGYDKNKIAIDKVVSSLSDLDSQLDLQLSKAKQREEGQKTFNAALESFWKITDDLSSKRIDIYSGVDIKKSQAIKKDIEDTSDALNKLKKISSENPDLNGFLEMQAQIDALKLKLSELGIQFKEALNIEIAAKNATEWTQYLAQTVGGDLVDAFNQMLTTGKLSFESIGRALLGMIKKLAAAAMAAAVLSAILSSIFPGAGGNGFKEIFGKITGMNMAGNSIPGASLVTNSSGINTSMATSSAMGSSSSVLETRVSGNDLVILLDRASNNRNKYF